MKIKKYLLNCFLLLIPAFVWNIIFYEHLPPSYSAEVFWKDIPPFIGYGEHILRIIIFAMPAFMMLSLETHKQKLGLLFYLIGMIIYFLSWLILILYPNSNWSNSAIGFTAPAFTTIFWLVGIGLVGTKTYFKFPYASKVYIALALLFVILHTSHAYFVFQNL